MGEVKGNNEAFWDLSYGLYIVTSREGERMNGQIATAAMQVTAVPPKIVVCLSKETLTHEFVVQSGKFGITVLDQEITMQEIGPWGFRSGRDIDKFRNVRYKIGAETGVPLVLDRALSVLEAKVIQSLDVDTHTLFVGEVEGAERLREGKPLTYDYYQKEKKGKSPKNAPTYHG
ncbi:MAG TPA: flavin reductase family protein [Candidatus Aminicenantes bacterium]|nr:flavin reductase family protein [Candidatus Aminicenantes bacterium]